MLAAHAGQKAFRYQRFYIFKGLDIRLLVFTKK